MEWKNGAEITIFELQIAFQLRAREEVGGYTFVSVGRSKTALSIFWGGEGNAFCSQFCEM